jgi:very-short-patch-repair endonuclease
MPEVRDELSLAVDNDDVTRTRVLSLIDYLAAYDSRRNPPIHNIGDYGMFRLVEAAIPEVPEVLLTPGADTWLTVKFCERPPRPALPLELEPLLGPASRISPTKRPQVSLPTKSGGERESERDPSQEAGEPSDGERVLLGRAEEWLNRLWEPWSRRHAEVSAAKSLYRDLFEQRELLTTDRDSLELCWGFGRVQWRSKASGFSIDYPMLSTPVEVDVDSVTNEIRIRPSGALEIEALYVSDVQLADANGFKAIREAWAADETGIDPWNRAELDDMLRRLVRTFDHDGVFVEGPGPTEDAATARPAWTVFMRRRRPDYQGFLDSMRDLYAQGVQIPRPLAALVVDEPSRFDNAPEWNSDVTFANRTVEVALLPLATNEEQKRIVELTQLRPGVTVQGPPGTGKSHTIANLISHYVAYGQRVLVVAEKEQALAVLADKVPAGIRDLTVSILGADEVSRRRLESSIAKIQTRVTAIDKQHVDNEISRIAARLESLDRAIAETTNRLFEADRRETEQLDGEWPPGTNPTPSVAAAWVAAEAERLTGILDELPSSLGCPLTIHEAIELSELLRSLGFDQVVSCEALLPEINSLPTGAELAMQFQELDFLQTCLASTQPDLAGFSGIDQISAAAIHALELEVTAERDWAVKSFGSWLERLAQQLTDSELATGWAAFLRELRSDREQILTLERALEAHTVTVPEQPLTSLEAHLADARDRLAARGKVGFLAGDAKRALTQCTVNGQPPTTTAEVELCLQAIRRQTLRRQMSTRWMNRVSRVDGPQVEAQIPEDAIGGYIADIDRTVSAKTRQADIRARLSRLEVTMPPNPSPDQLTRVVEVLRGASARPAERALVALHQNFADRLAAGASSGNASPLWQGLLSGLENRQTESWDACRSEVARLNALVPSAARLRQLHGRLRRDAPLWAEQVSLRPEALGDPALLSQAWQWRQLETWLTDVRRGDDPRVLRQTLADLANQRRRTIAELVTERAWRRLADNLGDRQRQALNSYLQAVKRFGKTGGKFAARWLAEIRVALTESQDAVPVWIMPASRALASFRPARVPPFDVLIIDEASQIGIEAIPLLGMAKRTIIVGDDRQTSPDNVGLDRESVFRMLDTHLSEIPKYRTLFDPDASLYDVAFQKFPGAIMLTEHFRCLPPIIEFSNQHAYDGRISPLRDKAPSQGWSPLGAIHVLDGYRSGDLNEPEARVVVDLVAEMCGDKAYDGMDFGVVSLLGSTQSTHIRSMLLERLGPDVMDERRIRCGEPASFQGDERDVIVLSAVVATDPDKPTGKIGALTSRSAERRLNVAASRARNQMWIVHSIEPDRFPAGDWRSSLIRHCQSSTRVEVELSRLEDRCDSKFEKDVLRRVLARGYRQVRMQHTVGRYRIDMVIEGPDARLAVECDGDRWHGDDRWHHDRARQEVLERAGWTFERIRGSAFYRDPDTALEPLWRRLESLGIRPGADWVVDTTRSTVRSVRSRPLEINLASSPAGTEIDPDRTEAIAPALHQLVTAPAATAFAPPSTAAVSLLPNFLPPVAVTSLPVMPRATARPSDQLGSMSVRQPPEPSQRDGSAARVPEFGSAERQQPPVSDAILTCRQGQRPYIEWIPRRLPSVEVATESEIIAGLVDIVAAEGPMHALRAYQLYVKASGGQRVGRDIRQTFNRAMTKAVRARDVAQVFDNVPGQAGKTVYLPNGDSVVVRTLGPRQLFDVPRTEIRALADLLGTSNSSYESKRAILDALGLTRLTDRVSEYLDECLD